MKMKSRLAAGFAAVAVLALSVLTPTAANATELPATDEAAFRSTWDQYGVSAATQDALIAKFEADVPWDSLTNGSVPVSERKIKVGAETQLIETYADGSITITGYTDVEKNWNKPAKPGGGVTPQASIDQCVTVASSQYDITQRCRVWTNVVVATFAYNVQFWRGQGVYGRIDSVSGVTYSCNGGTCTNLGARIIRKYETATLPAETQSEIVFNCYGGACTRNYWLNFRLKGATTSASNN